MLPAEIERTITQWEKDRGVIVSSGVRCELVEDFAPESELECFGILDAMRQARPDEFSRQP